MGLALGLARLGRRQCEVLSPGHLVRVRVVAEVMLRVGVTVRVRVGVGVGVGVRVRLGLGLGLDNHLHEKRVRWIVVELSWP